MIRVTPLLVIGIVCGTVVAQQANVDPNSPAILKTTSTFVSVPTLVRTAVDDPVHNLSVEQFRLFDETVPQKVLMEKTEDLPISLVILAQTGGSAARQFASYTDFPALLNNLLGNSEHEIALVTFDTKIEQIWHFPAHSDGVIFELTHLLRGDNGAAIRDAVHFGVNQLQGEPGRFRRVVLLLSQNADQGSATTAEALLKQLGTSSTIVYSMVFPGARARYAARQESEPNALSGAAGKAIKNLNSNTAAEMALLTGGSCVQFNDRGSFNSALLEVTNGIRGSYMLGFQPSLHTIGFHSIHVEVAPPKRDLHITARSAYWFNPVDANE